MAVLSGGNPWPGGHLLFATSASPWNMQQIPERGWRRRGSARGGGGGGARLGSYLQGPHEQKGIFDSRWDLLSSQEKRGSPLHSILHMKYGEIPSINEFRLPEVCPWLMPGHAVMIFPLHPFPLNVIYTQRGIPVAVNNREVSPLMPLMALSSGWKKTMLQN